MAEQVLTPSDIYSIISSNRFIDGIQPKLGKKMAGAVLKQIDHFSAKQKRNLTNCVLVSNFGEMRSRPGELEQAQGSDEDTASQKVNDMMARCLAFAQEKSAELSEAGNRDKSEMDNGDTKEDKIIDQAIETPKASGGAVKTAEKKTDGKSEQKND